MFLYILIYDVPLFQDAAKYLQKEADKWEDENNPIVQVAKEMSSQMEQMAEYCQGEGPVGVSFDMKGSTNNNFLFFPFILFVCLFGVTMCGQ